MCQAEPAPAPGGLPVCAVQPGCPRQGHDASDRLPGPVVLGSGSEPACPQAQDSLTVPGAGLKPLGPAVTDALPWGRACDNADKDS